jgi:RNA polymerase sigma-70 factor (ECF subfamily)
VSIVAPTPECQPAARLDLLLESLRQPLWRYLRVLGCEAALADDLVQEAFLVVLRRPAFVAEASRAVFAFLRATARQLWLTARRRRVALRDVDAGDAVWTQHCGDGFGEERLAALRHCVDALPSRSRELLAATYGEELGRGDCARRFGLSPDGVKTALRRLRAALRACIERRTPEHER